MTDAIRHAILFHKVARVRPPHSGLSSGSPGKSVPAKEVSPFETLRQIFAANGIIIFAIYGQAFFTLGVALAMQSMKHTRLELGKHLHWLAAFGLSHGLVEWGYVFIPIQATYLPSGVVEGFWWLQLALMVASFVFLLQFGVRTVARPGCLRRPYRAWWVAGALLGLVVVLALGLESDQDKVRVGIEIWARYLLAVPGAVASAIGTYRSSADVEALDVPGIGRRLRVAAWSLAGYALLNLVTPAHHGYLAQWVNYATIEDWIGVPVQLWRALVGFGILYGMIRSLPVFEVESDRMLEAARSEWIHRILSAQEDERRRVAHELHDEVIQELVLLCRRLDSIEDAGASLSDTVLHRVGEARAATEDLIARLRTFARDLRPATLDDLGVVASIRRLMVDLSTRTGIRWDLTVRGSPRRLARDTELGLFRIAQEAIRNVERHAAAQAIRLELTFGADTVSLRVADDGRGMAPVTCGRDLAASGRLGILGMQERAALLGGELKIRSEPGVGTTVVATVPARSEVSGQTQEGRQDERSQSARAG